MNTYTTIHDQLQEIRDELQALDVALTALARHEREVTGNTVTADNATTNVMKIANTLWPNAYRLHS
jgi:hypothetical protein